MVTLTFPSEVSSRSLSLFVVGTSVETHYGANWAWLAQFRPDLPVNPLSTDS